MTRIANVIREVTAAMQSAIAEGYRARMIDAEDLVEVLLAIADRLDPPVRGTANEVAFPCPDCGERNSDRLEVQDGDLVHCRSCGVVFDPAAS